MEKALQVYTFSCGPVSTNAYLVLCTKTRDAAIVDPSPGSFEESLSLITDLNIQPTKALLTHSHWDHITDLSRFVKAYNCDVFVHSEDAPNVLQPGSDGLRNWLSIDPVTPTKLLEEGETVAIGLHHFVVIHTPGHSPGGICLYCKEQNMLFSGDTLFRGTIGRLDLPTSEPKRILESLEKLSKLSPETEVLSGHGPKTTIGREAWLQNPKEYQKFILGG